MRRPVRSLASLLALAGGVAIAQPEQPAAPAPAPAPAPGAAAGALDRGAENAALVNEITPEMNQAVTRGLAWLAASQMADGSFSGGMRYGPHVGITALACIAFMADGHLPGRGVYGANVQRGLEYVLSNITETGLLSADTSHGPMYGHGFATLFLGEIYGMTAGGPDTALAARVHEALVKAVRLIIQSQNGEGGWRYNPVPYDADISVTICEIMALRSARNAGIEVPRSTIDRAVEYVRKCQNPDGGFKYQLTGGGSAWPRSAAGMASLYYAGVYNDPALDRAAAYLLGQAMPDNPELAQGAHYFYGMYYSAQAMYLAGGESWARWWPIARDTLVSSQAPEGFWDDQHAGPQYGTAMALIVLQMPKRYLPIFQK